MNHVVVVGASLAGLRAAEQVRAAGFGGDVTIVGEEPHLPYDRPPLSKRLLSGEWEPDRIALRKPDDMSSLDVTWRTGVAATGLDVEGHSVSLSDGTNLSYDGLLITTGAAPRRLPGQEQHAHVHELRTIDDAMTLRDELGSGDRRVVVIGAGFIGLEVAATARQLGNDVLVLEAGPAPMMRALGAEMGSAVALVHTDHGVNISCAIGVSGFERHAVLLDDGGREPAELVVVGVGVEPNTGWLEGSGLQIDNGVVCRSDLNVGVPHVYAAGDVARWHNRLFDETMRVEHWTNAAEQGAAAAANLLAEAAGEPTTDYAPVPFFWSEQYDRRIQFLGHVASDDDAVIVGGSIDDRKFAALYGRNGRLQGVLGVNMPRMVMPFRAHLERRVSWDDALALAADMVR